MFTKLRWRGDLASVTVGVVRDSDVIELAGVFLALGAAEPFELYGEEDREASDVALQLHFPTGHTLDQVGATLDTLDTLFTAGFVAAEARASDQSVESVFERLIGDWDPLDLVWTVEWVEAGSLTLKGVFKRTGE